MSGYDTPIAGASADVLGRVGFAQGIARLASDAPAGWGVRIGVYGRWGEGKSSVLNMVASQLRAEGHLVAEFNPWGCTGPEDMVELLADTLIAAAKSDEREVAGTTSRVAKKGAKLLAKVGDALGGDKAKLVSPWLTRWAKERERDIAAVVQTLEEGERLIVLVDDVDRVDPKLLPRLFFALHEVFALPGVSFVLALDPDVVGAALAEYHVGFKSGVEFLAKIVQFPRWLPPPSPDALRSLTERDRATFAPFLAPEVLAEKANLLPTNPRELRAFIRGLWCLAHEIERHDEDEINQHLLVVLEALRQASPAFLSAILDREDLLHMSFVSMARKERRPKYEAEVRQLAESIAPDDAARVGALALALCGKSLRWTPENVRYHAYLAERPHALTWKEFRALLGNRSDGERETWTEEHARIRRVTTGAVANEIASTCVRAYRNALDEAATAGTASGNQARIEQAVRVLDVLEWLWFRPNDREHTRSPRTFLRVVQSFASWAHFILNDADKKQRLREQDLATRMARAATPPLDYLEALAPWDPRHELHDESATLMDSVLAEIQGRASDDLLRVFERPSGVSGAIFGARAAEPYLLLHREPMWTHEQRASLLEIVARGGETIADNCRVFLDVVMDPGRHHGVNWDTSSVRQDVELLRVVWAGATSVAIQARFFNALARVRDGIEAVLGGPPPLPGWWESVRVAAVTRRKNSEPAVDSAGDDDEPLDRNGRNEDEEAEEQDRDEPDGED